MLKIRREALELIFAQACEEYPQECCGVLTVGPESEFAQVHRCRNLQQKKHEENPREFPRNARIAYFLDPQEFYEILSRAEDAGEKIAGFYHSHVDCGAYFSAEDRQRAMTFGDEPDYPEAVYLVLSVCGEEAGRKGREVVEYKGFGWDHRAGRFAEVEVVVVDRTEKIP